MKKHTSLRVSFAFAVIFAAASLFADDVKLENAVSPSLLAQLKQQTHPPPRVKSLLAQRY